MSDEEFELKLAEFPVEARIEEKRLRADFQKCAALTSKKYVSELKSLSKPAQAVKKMSLALVLILINDFAGDDD